MQSHLRAIQDASNYQNLVALATILQKLLRVQARFWPILIVFGPNDIEGQGQTSPFGIPTENYPRRIYMTNLVALATILQKFLRVKPVFGQF